MRLTPAIAVPVRPRYAAPVWLPTIGSLVAVIILGALVLAQMVPPAVVPATAPATVFSAARALDHLRVIARAPHPTGSPESAEVRQYLVDQLARLGLQPIVQTDTSLYHDTGKWGVAGPRGLETGPDTWSLAEATVHNVMARIPGTASTGAVVLTAHYDSVPYGPGASDDGAGVAAILEAARALLSGPALQNDVILLFLDGEEIGLMGSQAFSRHPWMNDVAVTLNLEARGSSGVALMYETSRQNGWLVEQYSRAAQRPVTSSLATDVWRRMPNSSDLTVFLAAGKQGMNFAYAENWTDYHTTHDSLTDLDERSLQHHGVNALSLARQFGSVDLTQRGNGESIFFSVLGLGMVRYPQAWAVPLLVATVMAAVLALGYGLWRGSLSLPGLAAGVGAFLTAAVGAGLMSFLAVLGLNALKGGQLSTGNGGTYDVHLYELGLLLLDLAITGAVYVAFQRRYRPADLAAGALIIWLLLAAVTTFLLPGGSYLFLWPTVAGLIALAAGLAARGVFSGPTRLLLLLPGIVGLLVAGGAVYLVQLMFGPIIFPAGAALIVLLLALIFPYTNLAGVPRAWAWAALAGSAGAGLLLVVGLTTPYSLAQPRQNFMFYSLDADTGTAAWVAKTTQPDETLAPWLGQTWQEATLENYFPAAWMDHVQISPAPRLDQPAPEMVVVEDTNTSGIRTLRLALHSPRQAWAVMMTVAAEEAILSVELNGERYLSASPRDHVFLKFVAVAPEAMEVTLQLRAGVPVRIRLGDVSPSLPVFDGQVDQAASGLRTGYGGGHGIDWMTLIQRRYTID